MYSLRTKMVKKGVVVKLSEIGHYGFHYPSSDKESVFSSDSIVNALSWGHQKGLAAITVLGSFLKGEEYSGDKRYVVWVNPADIESY